MTRVSDQMLKAAIIGQDYQAFTVVVESASGIDTWYVDIVAQRRPLTLVRKLAENPKRLVEQHYRHSIICQLVGRRKFNPNLEDSAALNPLDGEPDSFILNHVPLTQ